LPTLLHSYLYNIRWSTIEAIIFQSFLLAHQYMLFRVSEEGVYGCIGMLFGAVYLGVKVIDLGLSKILATYYLEYSRSRVLFVSFIGRQLLPTIILFFVIAGTLFMLLHIQYSTYITPLVLSILCMYTITEALKVPAKKVLQLSHHFRSVAFLEIAFITGYQLVIWGYYSYYHTLDLRIIFTPAMIFSFLELIGLLILLFRWVSTLPQICDINNAIRSECVQKNRLFAYFHSMSKQIISANVLVPVYAYWFGAHYAGVFKISSYCIHSMLAILEKIIEPTSSTLFAHIKNESQRIKQRYFSLAFHSIAKLMMFSSIMVIVIGIKIASHSAALADKTILLSLVFYFFLHYCEIFFVLIERFYVVQARSEFLIITAGSNILWGASMMIYPMPPGIAIGLLCLLRGASYIILLSHMSYTWNIQYPYRWRPQHIVATVLLSFLLWKAI